jgi:uncharacterized iron-regulated protein
VLARAPGRPTLVLLAHPQCSCTRASLDELGEALARAGTRPRTYVLFLKPEAFSIGWEMFDQMQQASLDAWDRGAISLRELFRDTGFDRGWAVYSQIYGKILETAQRSGRNNVALNAPPDLVRKVARGQSLSRQEKALLPRGFTTSGAAYRNFVSLMGDHPGLSARNLRSFFAAQNLWDQTMADRILRFERRQSGVKMVVLIGRGHVADGFGIPFYVGQKGALQQLILLP